MRILIVRLGALGDILHAVPAQQQLARGLPGSEIHWLVESCYRPLMEAIPGIDRVWTVDTKAWREKPLRSVELFGLLRSLRRQRFDLAFDFQGLIKSAALARWSGANRVLGFWPERFKEKGIEWFYTETADGEADLERHVIDANLDLVGTVIVVDAPHRPIVPLSVSVEDEQVVARQLATRGIREPVLISPGAGWATKHWPARCYAALGLEIEQRLELPVIYCYGPGEESLMDEIRLSAAPHPIEVFPTTVLQLACLCRRARVLIAGDCGPLHLAVSQGTPTVAILGPTAPKRNGPYNPEDEFVKLDLPCSNSYRRTCNEFVCMNIPVEAVFEALVRRLDKLAEASGAAASIPAADDSPVKP